ncbi:MAG: N-acetylmuramoyl-L-alanine amidase [Faecalibacterium prausnitzii]|nr:N-acetylmuramoyl-L-alanine amidase [Faecalibacterium prausnitzii]
MLCFGLFLWKAALELNAPAESAVSVSAEDFRPVVGDPPYRVAVDAGHGGSDPGARGVVEEKQVTAATATALLQWLEEDSNYIPLQTRESFDATATPAQRAAAASAQSPQLLLSIHGNSAANGSTASGFECYPAVPGRTWHQESFYFAKLLAGGMQSIGARLRGRGGVRYIYYLENDQKQLVENTYTQVRPERSFTLLEDVDCPAVLAEQCFVTNDEDVEHFGSEQGCKAVARIYYEAICAYFGTEPLPVK